ncbi:uncharacterized protein LOC142239641 [Haematobia irritans]|uniref:uncharacterized protein LOC142239641 n=1 Tax=Haematobia irritans TaxID=7368 RepID=UPI003F5062B4
MTPNIRSTTIALMLLAGNLTRWSNHETTTLDQPQMVNNEMIMEIVDNLHKIYKFENFIFYISRRLQINNEIGEDFLQGFWRDFPLMPMVVMTSKAGEMKGFLSASTLCMILTTNLKDPIMEIAARGMEGVRFLHTLFILFPLSEGSNITIHSHQQEAELLEHIHLLYKWIWNRQFINTALITINENVFIQEPYPRARVINVTGLWSAKTLFINYRVDFQGYVIRTPLHHDLPRVFYMTRIPNGWKRKHRVSGFSGKLFMTFVEHINATFVNLYKDHRERESVKIDKIIHMVENNELDLSLHSYTDMLNTTAGNSYPIGINDWCIMVPYRKRSPEHIYLQKSFNSYTWLLICFSIFYITGGVWFCSSPENRDWGQCFLQAISSMIMTVPLRIATLPMGHMRFIYVLLFIMGFIITNVYLSKMASFLTTSPHVKQINTVQDVIAAKLPIMVLEPEYANLMDYNLPKEFMDLIINVTKQEMDRNRDRFNTAYGYSTQTDRWEFANLQQINLKYPIFRLSDICIGPYYHVYPMKRDSHLAIPLETFIIAAAEAGLTHHWKREAFADAVFLKYLHMMLVNDEFLPLTLDFYRIVV